MVAIIKTSHSIRGTFLYNDNKVKEGVADCISAENYPMALSEMNQQQRLNMLLRTAAKNPNVKANSVHISLNFAPGEELSHDKLREIATEYMEKIGFGEQPYLVYQHHDAGHCHAHIATVKVRPDGSRMELKDIGKNLSRPACESLEIKHGLIKAKEHDKALYQLKPVGAGKVKYGKVDTKRAITNVLDVVLYKYRFTSLSELNAVLNLYNVHADRGEKDSRTYKNNGLYYCVLDENGQPIGVPIKASLFYNKPTLKKIGERFLINDSLRQPNKSKIKAAIDFALLKRSGRVQPSILSMKQELEGKGIATVLRQNDGGRIYGITFVDHQSKAVFNGSDLGKPYGINGILERITSLGGDAKKQSEEKDLLVTDKHNDLKESDRPGSHIPEKSSVSADSTSKENGILDDLLKVEHGADYLQGQWKQRRKRRKRAQSNRI